MKKWILVVGIFACGNLTWASQLPEDSFTVEGNATGTYVNFSPAKGQFKAEGLFRLSVRNGGSEHLIKIDLSGAIVEVWAVLVKQGLVKIATEEARLDHVGNVRVDLIALKNAGDLRVLYPTGLDRDKAIEVINGLISFLEIAPIQEAPSWYVNEDGVVDIYDLVIAATNFGKNGKVSGDVNVNGTVDILDLGLISQHFGEILQRNNTVKRSSQNFREIGSREPVLETKPGHSMVP